MVGETDCPADSECAAGSVEAGMKRLARGK
jgi:hypothetical protein